MKVLPRYPFKPSGVGCADHDDPDCLCDVVLSGPSIKVDTSVPHMFHATALREIDDDVVSERNLVEFMSVVLGLHTAECEYDGAPSVPQSAPVWDGIPQDVIDNLKVHSRVDTDPAVAMLELEGLDLDSKRWRQLRAKYVNWASVYRCQRKAKGWRPKQWAGHDYEVARERERAKQRLRAARPDVMARNAEASRIRRQQIKTGLNWKDSGGNKNIWGRADRV